jgi:hypothetical protein
MIALIIDFLFYSNYLYPYEIKETGKIGNRKTLSAEERLSVSYDRSLTIPTIGTAP